MTGLTYGFMGLFAAEWVVFLLYPMSLAWLQSITTPILAFFAFIFAVNGVIEQRWVSVIVNSTFSTYYAYRWWNDEDQRRKRKKLRDKLAGRVADLGGRLGIVRPNET